VTGPSGRERGADEGRLEREVKLEADPDLVLPDLDALVAGASVRRRQPIELDAIYFDSADLRLLDHGVSVRRRTGDGTRWTVKVPITPSGADSPGASGAVAREEHDVVDDASDPPTEVRRLVARWLGDAALVPVARLVSTRARLDVRATASDQVVAEVDDDLVVVLADDREVGRFREIEIELAPGLSDATATAAAGVVDAVADELVAAGARRGDPRPKVDRALAMIRRA
jgi:inorganic triphosphatase YgiF